MTMVISQFCLELMHDFQDNCGQQIGFWHGSNDLLVAVVGATACVVFLGKTLNFIRDRSFFMGWGGGGGGWCDLGSHAKIASKRAGAKKYGL